MCAVEDTAILDASMDIITSRKVRDKKKLTISVDASAFVVSACVCHFLFLMSVF
jgi:hypothetical protein